MIQRKERITAGSARGRELLPHEEMLMFHQHAGAVYETLERLQENLSRVGVDYVVIGAFALACYEYERATTDVDLCLRWDDLERLRQHAQACGYEAVPGKTRRFRDSATGVTFDLLVSGELAGRVARNKHIRFPDPSEAVTVKGLPTVSLERLVELKLVTWRFRDWADVVELIRRNNLGEDFAERLHPLVHMAYLECYDQKVEEDRYEEENPPRMDEAPRS